MTILRSMPRIRAIVMLLLTAVAASAPVAAPKLPTSIDVTVILSVSEAGRATRIDFVESMPDSMQGVLRSGISRWQFKPGKRNGKPVASESSLYLTLAVEGHGDDVRLRVERALTGPRYEALPRPRYPLGAVSAKKQAIVLVRAEVQPDGTVADAYVHAIRAESGKKQFERASVEAVKRARFVTERVGGVPMGADVIVPISYLLPGYPAPKWPDTETSIRGNEIAVDAEVKIESDVVGSIL